ncbi:hypothetical protein ACQUQU_18400 [Thalassolituus sp. LLYu03]|uniref:hypothetical protein n=1 Tax=Thalassolituus sp. LLYu03 TaxID=3421656 RepID=UPI003D28B2ED
MKSALTLLTALTLASALPATLVIPQAEATYTPKIKNIRIRQTTETGAGSYRFEVVSNDSVTPLLTDDGIADPYDVQVVVNKNRVLELQPGPLLRRLSSALFITAADKTTLTLVLEDARGDVLFKGIGRGSAGSSARFESATYADGAGFTVGAFSVSAYAGKNNFGFAVDINGDGATAVVSARLISSEDNGSRVPVVREVSISDEAISRERIYSTQVTFSADPVGSLYDTDVILTGEGIKEKTSTTLEVIRLPGADGAPGPVMAVTGNGRGTRNSASDSGQTQPAELL